jgi:plastocyanin
MNCLTRLSLGILLSATVTLGCSGSSSNNTPGTGGTSGGGTGGTGTGGTSTAGTGGASAGGTGGTGQQSFMATEPCTMETSYTTTGNTIDFGGATGFAYAPNCLQVSAGATVTFNGDFTTHPLDVSAARGTLTGNPITLTNTGTTKSFTFPTPGFYAYYCMFHGFDTGGTGMAGVIWVK